MTTESVIMDYYGSWLNGDRDRARSLLADDLKFRSPQDNFDTADAFLGTCWKLSESFDAMDVIHEVFDASGGYLVYRSGSFLCGEFVKVRDGRIAEIYVTFNPTA
ncbi:MAG: hypothetical protein ACR2PO_08070 [Methyloligellaceae bacterium]